MEYNFNEIAERIRKIRKDKGISSQDKLRDMLIDGFDFHIGRNKLSDIENGEKDALTFEFLYYFSKLVDCDIGYLLGEYDEKTQSVHQICKFTGLNEKAVNTLSNANKTKILLPIIKTEFTLLNALISSGFLYKTSKNLHDYIDSLLFSKMIKLDNPDIDVDTYYISLDFNNFTDEDSGQKNNLCDILKNENDNQNLDIFKMQKQYIEFIENLAKKIVDNFTSAEEIENYLQSNVEKQKKFFDDLYQREQQKTDAYNFIKQLSKMPQFTEIFKNDNEN